MSQQPVIAVVVAGWAALALKLFHLNRGWRSPAIAWISASLAVLALSITLQLTIVRAAVDAVTTLNTAGTLSNCATLMAGMCAQCAYLHMVRKPADAGAESRKRLLWTAGVIVLMLVLFATVPSNYADMLASIDKPLQVPVVSAAAYVYVTYLTVLCAGLIRTSRTYLLIADRFSLRYGLLLIALAAVVTIAYAVARFSSMLTYQLGVEVAWLRGNLIGNLYLTAAGLVVVGIALPLVGGRLGLDHLAQWWRINRWYRELHPLWKVLHDEFPTLALDVPAGSNVSFHYPEHALYRRVIEIWDGRLRLRPHLDPSAVPGDSAAEAALIADALRRRRNGVAPTDGRSAPDNRPDDPDAELDWLIAVSRALPR